MHGQRFHVYMDGSGVTLVIAEAGISPSFRLGRLTSPITAELAAIFKALEYISTQNVRLWIIFTDSHASLQALPLTREHCINNQVTFQILQLLYFILQAGQNVCFQWMTAHCGIAANEVADTHVKAAHNSHCTID